MPTVASVMDKVAREVKVAVPNGWVAATTLTYMELKDLLQETVDELLERVDWPDPIAKDTTVTGTGVETYSLPSDFKRMTRDDLAVYESTSTRRACIAVTTRGQWTHLQDIGSAAGNRYYRLSGDEESGYEISFFRDLETDAEVTASYVSKNWLVISSTEGSVWSDEGATLLLPRRLIELGVVWRFRRRKGLAYLDRYNEYEGMIAKLSNDKKGLRSIGFGEPDELPAPMRVPVPDYIPSA